MTGAVDLVLPVAKIPNALREYGRRVARSPLPDGSIRKEGPVNCLSEIIQSFPSPKTTYDFTQYKEGTLQRRVERRMAMTAAASRDINRYLEILRSHDREVDLVAKDLLINVTSFFRDPKVFDLLAKTIVPELVRSRTPDPPSASGLPGAEHGRGDIFLSPSSSVRKLRRQRATSSFRSSPRM